MPEDLPSPAVKFRIEQRFARPLAAVEDAFVDPAFLARLAELPKLGAPELVSREEVDGRVHQSVHYHFTGDLNAAARRVLDPTRLSWVEESTLDRSTHITTWRIVPDHYGRLIRCHGTFRLVAEGDSVTTRVAEADMKVSFPVVGGQVERAIVSGIEEHAALEERVLQEWLTTDR